MANPYGDINTIYKPYNTGEFNERFKPDLPLQSKKTIDGPPTSVTGDMMDESYEAFDVENASNQDAIFSDILGSNVNIYDSQSIADALMDKYGMEGLTPGMFPAMSEQLMESTQASTFDPLKRLLASPKSREFGKMIQSSAGLLNPNKARARAKRLYRSGMSDIDRNIFQKTSMARQGVRDWLNNALAKVRRMKY